MRKNKNKIRIKIYELNSVREIEIDLGNGKDRARLRHILNYERYRLKKRDITKYEELLENS